MLRSKQNLAMIFGLLLFAVTPMIGCKETPPPMPKIDLNQVDEAFRTSTGVTFGSWMANFEWSVNQIYAGKEFVSVSARRYGSRRSLVVYGYIEKNKRPGYQLSDELIFKVKQIRGAWKFQYRVEDHIGWAPIVRTYKRGSSSVLPAFYTSVVIMTWRPYYTPRTRLVLYRSRRSKYRKSSAYKKRRARAKKFRSKAKKAAKSRSKARRSSRRRGGKR